MQKLEFLNLEPGMGYLGVLDSNLEKPLPYLQSLLWNLPCCKVWYKKLKSLNWGLKMPDFRIMDLEFENIIVIFEASVLEFVLALSLA